MQLLPVFRVCSTIVDQTGSNQHVYMSDKLTSEMSDYEKNKFFRRTKYYPTQRDGTHTSHYGIRPFNKTQPYVKYDRDYKDADRASETKEKSVPQPTILLKTREPNTERSVSPKRLAKENEPPPVHTSTTQETAPSSMVQSVKLIEDGTLNVESVQEHLLDSPDFLVVGILGTQGVGKSTIMNLLAQNKLTDQIKSDIFNYTGATTTHTEPIKILTDNMTNLKVAPEESKNENQKDFNPSLVFKPQSLEQIEVGNYGTSGVDVFITSNRVFLLDCQPIISAAVLDEIVQSDFKRNVAGEFLPIENSAEIQSLQLATFVLSVCHVVVIIQDWFFDSNLVRFIQTAEMLKPSIPTAEEDYMEYYPHVIILHNRSTLEDFTPNKFKTMQQVYRDVFSKSKLRFESGMGLATGNIMHALSPVTCGDPFNLFLLPEYKEDKDTKYYGHPPFDELVQEFRAQIHGVTRIPLLTAQLTEKNWLQFSSKVWDTIKKSSFFVEYSKLMP